MMDDEGDSDIESDETSEDDEEMLINQARIKNQNFKG